MITNVPAQATIVGVPGHIVAFHDDSNGVMQRLPDPEWDRLNQLDERVDELRELLAHLEDHVGGLHDDHHSEERSRAEAPPRG